MAERGAGQQEAEICDGPDFGEQAEGGRVSEKQYMALRIMQVFVRQHGGEVADIRIEDGAYRWAAPDGRVAVLGWDG